MPFTFAIAPDESTLDRWYRLFDSLLAAGAVSLEEHPDTLASFLDITSTPGLPIGLIDGHSVTDVSRWKTNCAMTMHAALVWCGRILAPFVNGESIEQYVELRRGAARWVKNDGVAKPKGPAVFYVGASAALPYDHVGAFGRELAAAPRSFVTYEGGGGDGTRISKGVRSLDRADSYGRRIEGWWEIGDLLPASPETVPSGPSGDTSPETVSGIAGVVAIATLAVLLAGCAPSLRSADASALRHVQIDLARRQLEAAPGADRVILKTEFCELDAVLVAAGEGSVAAPIKCR